MGNKRVLVCVDFSNWMYYTICGAFSAWCKESDNAHVVKCAKETDQDNLPNLLVYDDFKRTLHNYIHKRLETISYIIKQNHQDEVDECIGTDVILTEDDNLAHSFRKIRYPDYKAQRKLIQRQYDIPKIKDYILNVALKELNLEDDYGFSKIRVEGAESDDLIAVIMKRMTDYECRILISSDHDFLQLDNVHQYDMAGRRVDRVIDENEISAKDFLLWKIIRGDVSDNIKGVFKGYGEKKSLKLVSDKAKVKTMLKESRESAEQFMKNKFLIDFSNIPTDLEERIYAKVVETLNNKKNRDNGKNLIALNEDVLRL